MITSIKMEGDHTGLLPDNAALPKHRHAVTDNIQPGDTVIDQENIHRPENNNNIMPKEPTPEEKAEKYGLRPRTIIKRLQQETRRQETAPPKPKPREKRSKKARPAPLSKYRRKTANARERDRMKAVNVAFESLRRVLPDALDMPQQSVNANTTTKITTLRQAVDYIQALTQVLENPQQHQYIRENVTVKKEKTFDIKSERDFEVERYQLPHLIEAKNLIMNTQYQHNTIQQTQKDHHQLSMLQQEPSYITGLNAMDYKVQTPTNISSKQTADFCSLLVPSPDQSYFSLSSNSSSSLDSHGSSTSDLDELLSEDSHLLEGSLNAFQDISSFSETDPFDILYSTDSVCDKSSICYTDQMYS